MKPSDQRLAAMLRVNHAGEYGATRIYQGQLDWLRDSSLRHEIEHMAKQEQQHLAYFETLLPEKRVRPSALMPLWHVGGYLLGAATALMGPRAAMACTVSVEEVIDEHYQEQIDTLARHGETELKQQLETFRAEELAHRDTALELGAEAAPAYPLLHSAISCLSRFAIGLAKRI
jgi:ubiquinone biosynthesis monooxygenase Coq7